MREDPDKPVGSRSFIFFPTRYKFKRSAHGIDELASIYDKVHVLKTEMCMSASSGGTNRVHMANCTGGSPDQNFYYEANTHRIRLRRNGHCVHYNNRDRIVYLRVCNEQVNQKWYYDSIRQGIQTWGGKCMTWVTGSIWIDDCYGGLYQKFIIPSQWLPAMSLQRIRVSSEPGMCMDVDSSNKLKLLTCDHEKASQEFEYNALTREIKRGELCMDYHLTQYYVYMYRCHGGNNQKWYFESSTKRLRTGWDSKCLDWDGVQLRMTTCALLPRQTYYLPENWGEGISQGTFDEVRVFSNLQLCMTLLDSNTTVTMSKCENGNKGQRLYYDVETLQIKLHQSGRCVDYNYHTGEVYMHTCHGGNNQMWYQYSSDNYLKSFHDSKCMSVSNDKLTMEDCRFLDSQKFLVPAVWSAMSYNQIRSMNNPTKCIVYDPDQSNNVYASECNEDGGLSHEFEYNPSTGEVKLDGLCLDIVLTSDQYETTRKVVEGNVIMWPCNGERNQKWTFGAQTNHIQTMYGVCKFGTSDTSCCLELGNDGNINGRICTSERKQMFLAPDSWVVEEVVSETNYPYYYQPFPPAIWSSDLCHVDLMQNMIKTCDNSMKLLLGPSTSLGTLRSIAKLVNEKGPQRMPGICCLDSPLTSQFFGYHVSKKLLFDSCEFSPISLPSILPSLNVCGVTFF